MNIPLVSHLLHLIEEILKAEAPAIGKIAAQGAVMAAEQDPKVQAITAASASLLIAVQDMKAVIKTPPTA